MLQKLVLVTSGEPSGIGPDICIDLAMMAFRQHYTIMVLGDAKLLASRARLLNKSITIKQADRTRLKTYTNRYGELLVLDHHCPKSDCIAKPLVENVDYVLAMLDEAIDLCKQGFAHIIVTAPVSKEVINCFGIKFLGHTEYLASAFACDKVVMMLANEYLKVALLTVHMPLRNVAEAVTCENLNQTLGIIITAFQLQYNVSNPKIAVCGLNPHAGEGGYLGDEELRILNPVIKSWQERGYLVSGPHPADTVFNQSARFDVILAMYHDQGLPVLKYSGFETGVNVTLGLPIIRVSVDHGTALDLAGTGLASSKSLGCAIEFALKYDQA